MSSGERKTTIRSRGRLPHWEQDYAAYFVTFRLFDSLPKTVLEKLIAEPATDSGGPTLAKRLEQYLDSGGGACYLMNSRIADVLAETIRKFDSERYRLFAWCIMPNHVHVVVQPMHDFQLQNILHSWKSYSSQMANRILGRKGSFWQREYYDHLLRDGELARAISYTAENPAKAGLLNWKWVYVSKNWT